MKKSPISNINMMFGIAIVVLIVIGGFALLFTGFLSEQVTGPRRIVLALIFFVYAIYRSYRIYRQFKTYGRYENDRD